MITTSHWLFFSFSILLVSGSFLLSKSLACLSNSLICLKRQDQIIFLIGNLKSWQKRKRKTLVIYASLQLSHLHGIQPMSYPPPLKEGRRWHLIHGTFAKEKWKNTHTKHQQQQYHIPIGFWTYNLIHHPILVEGRSAIRPKPLA